MKFINNNRNWLRLSLITILLLFTFSCKKESRITNSTSQLNIIAELSGHQALEDGSLMHSRSNRQERKKARQYLSQLIANMGLEPQLQAYSMPNIHPVIDWFFDPFTGKNVYTILPATQPSETYLVLGAHFDTERKCPGAIDNGSGVSLIYAVVQKLSELEHRNKNTILIFFDQEEEELNGSRAFAGYLKKNNFDIHSVHTIDAIGWDKDGDLAVEVELPGPALEMLYHTEAAKLNIPIYFTTVNSTDHHSFRELGFPSVGLTDEYVNGDYTPYKDTPKDTYEP